MITTICSLQFQSSSYENMEALCYAPQCDCAVQGYVRELEREFEWDGRIMTVISIIKWIVSFVYGSGDVFRSSFGITSSSFGITSYNECGHLEFKDGSVLKNALADICWMQRCGFAMGTVSTNWFSYSKHRYEWVIKTIKVPHGDDPWFKARGLNIRIGLKCITKKYSICMFGYGSGYPIPIFHHDETTAVVADMETNTAYLFGKDMETNKIKAFGHNVRGQKMVPLQSGRFSLYVTLNQSCDKVEIISCKIKTNGKQWAQILKGTSKKVWF